MVRDINLACLQGFLEVKISTEQRITRISSIDNLELLRAKHLRQSFPRHTHERYAIGVIEQGALGFYYRGENVVATSGNISLCIPGEVHTGQPAGAEGWTYRMFYFDVSTLEKVASEIADRPHQLPFFQSGVIEDAPLAYQLRQLHYRLEQKETPRLEQETALVETLARMIVTYADDRPPVYRVGQETSRVKILKQYIESNYSEDVSLSELSHLTHLSRYHLVRVFHNEVGLPPHAYLRQVRVKEAKRMLASGQPIASVAAATGFTDQSHLTRWFKRLWGVTPGQYRNSVQDGYLKV